MMTYRQFLLLKLAEECAEVAQRALKQMQFGRDEIQHDQELTNSQRLYQELIDLLAVKVLLISIDEIPEPRRQEALDAMKKKQMKMKKYYEYSQSLGMVEASNEHS
jgi:NTP pyrophosphatase (non-canonical NTP hydrolase)